MPVQQFPTPSESKIFSPAVEPRDVAVAVSGNDEAMSGRRMGDEGDFLVFLVQRDVQRGVQRPGQPPQKRPTSNGCGS